MLAFWTILMGILCNVACAILGSFLVLRRMSLLGDAISHGVLPGIVVGFLLSGQLAGPGLLLGAMAFGLLTAFLTQTVHSLGRVPEDASMGIVFTSLFALGVILIRFVPNVDLDPGCVFYGMLAELDRTVWFGLEVPRAVPGMLLALVLTVAFVLVFWKELKIVSFDPALATAMGFRAGLVHYLLMAMVAGVTVTSFAALGSIVVVAMLIVPGATAYLLSDRLAGVVLISTVVAGLSSVLGFFLSPENGNVAGMMAVLAGAQFLLAALFAPRHGILARMLRNARLALRIVREDILAGLYRLEEAPDSHPAAEDSRNPLLARLAHWQLRFQNQARLGADGVLHLTEAGRHYARSLVRAHRLWEAYLAQNFDLPPDHLHDPATRMEHFIGPTLQTELEAELHQPGTDPHGRTIPPPEEKEEK